MSLTVNEKLSPVARVFDAMDKSYLVGSEFKIAADICPRECRDAAGTLRATSVQMNRRAISAKMASEEVLAAEVMRERRLIENLREGDLLYRVISGSKYECKA